MTIMRSVCGPKVILQHALADETVIDAAAEGFSRTRTVTGSS